MNRPNPYAVATGASSGLGREFAKLAIGGGYDRLIAADEPAIHDVAAELGSRDRVQALEVDLSEPAGVEAVVAAIGGRRVDVLCANAGRGLDGALVDADYRTWRHVIETNVVGTTHLLREVARRMTAQGSGRILVTGSIAGLGPGLFEPVYSGTKTYLNSLAQALREGGSRRAGVRHAADAWRDRHQDLRARRLPGHQARQRPPGRLGRGGEGRLVGDAGGRGIRDQRRPRARPGRRHAHQRSPAGRPRARASDATWPGELCGPERLSGGQKNFSRRKLQSVGVGCLTATAGSESASRR